MRLWERLPGRRLHAVPLALALLFFAASLTPSLIPRGVVLQGVLGGIVAAIGYLIGRTGLSLWRYLGLPEPEGRRRGIARVVTIVPFALLALWCLANVAHWQDSVRAAVAMPPVDATHGVEIVAIAALLFALLILAGRAVRWVFDAVRTRVARRVPRRVANVVGLLAAVLVVTVATRDGLIDLIFRVADGTYATAAAFFDPEEPPPADPVASGGPGSLIEWGAIGAPGRDYVLRGPTADEIAAFTGRPALQPLRVYVGLEQDPDPVARAALAVAELERIGGFGRANLVIALPTGTGWLDAGSFAPMEHLLEGDVATVAAQYSYLNSPFALVFETRTGLDQATALIEAVTDRWRALPEDARPRLWIHGLSLGAWSSMFGMDLFQMVNDPVDGAFWAGPPFPSDLWHRVLARRTPDSPYVLPTVEDGRLARFVAQNPRIDPDGWGRMRIAFLQYASDAIVFYEPAAAWRRPVWMTEPPAHDVSPHLRWMPVVTMLQLALDMAVATSVPDGYGHNYIARDYIPVWAALLEPEGWSAQDVARLQAHCDYGRGEGCRPPEGVPGSIADPD